MLNWFGKLWNWVCISVNSCHQSSNIIVSLGFHFFLDSLGSWSWANSGVRWVAPHKLAWWSHKIGWFYYTRSSNKQTKSSHHTVCIPKHNILNCIALYTHVKDVGLHIWPCTQFIGLHQVHKSRFIYLCVLCRGENKNILVLDIDDQDAMKDTQVAYLNLNLW